MKVRFYCDSGANIHSCRDEVMDVEKDLDITPDEWNALPEDEKQEYVNDWAANYLEIGWEEVDE